MGEDQKNGSSSAIREYRDGKITAAEYLKRIREATGHQVRHERAVTRKRAQTSQNA